MASSVEYSAALAEAGRLEGAAHVTQEEVDGSLKMFLRAVWQGCSKTTKLSFPYAARPSARPLRPKRGKEAFEETTEYKAAKRTAREREKR